MLTDAITFRVWGGPLVNLLVAPIVRLQLAGLFAYRHKATCAACQ